MRLLLVCALALLLAACGEAATPAEPAAPGAIPLGTDPVVAADATVAAGDPAPALRFTYAGEERSLEDYRGKTVILNFWETTCVPCAREMPDFEAISKERADVVVLAVNRGEAPAVVEAFADRYDLTFPLILDRDRAVSEAYGVVITIPTSYFIGPDGTIARIQIGAMSHSQITRFLDEIASASSRR